MREFPTAPLGLSLVRIVAGHVPTRSPQHHLFTIYGVHRIGAPSPCCARAASGHAKLAPTIGISQYDGYLNPAERKIPPEGLAAVRPPPQSPSAKIARRRPALSHSGLCTSCDSLRFMMPRRTYHLVRGPRDYARGRHRRIRGKRKAPGERSEA